MYNRYIPGTNGVYERHCVQEPGRPSPPDEPIPVNEPICSIPAPPTDMRKPSCSPSFDLGDLLLLCIVVLLLLDSEQEDLTTILITAAAFLFLQ